MRIYSMTATFGKLENQTLSFREGLNVIHAPNEWGKSTWCAFLVAMLYGIDTKERTKQGSLADKERYAPWSGSPMSGRMELCWEGRDITIERRTKGRVALGEFQAYETATGLPVTELTAANCGQLLLGVEKSVFTRAGFIKLTDLPVSDDDALRRRLNALVTTGDESGASDKLAQKLKELKNRCRHNKTGKIPDLETQRDDVRSKLEKLRQLQEQNNRITRQQDDVREQIRLLENHIDALAYAAAEESAQRVAAANAALAQAEQVYREQKARCDSLPDSETAQENILQLDQLRMQQNALWEETLPPAPQKPDVPNAFAGMTPAQALQQAKSDKSAFDMLSKPLSPVLWILAAVCLACAAALLFWDWKLALPFPVFAAVLIAAHLRSKRRQKQDREAIAARYAPLAAMLWIPLAEDYRNAVAEYTQLDAAHKALSESLASRKAALAQNVAYFTGGDSLEECLDGWRKTLSMHEELKNARNAWEQARAHAEALADMTKPAQPPAFADTLTQSDEVTRQLLAKATQDLQQLQLQQGHNLGQMESLGQESALVQQLSTLQAKIDRLEDIYAATVLALDTLAEASATLQRKFAPRISQRAQSLFARLTNSRYDRLLLDEDLRIRSSAQGEASLHDARWRSDGTADQQYLALRLAVSAELTPGAPLILDDALVRFDETRLASAMEILKEEADTKQVIVFTCQGREQALLNTDPVNAIE